jgi:hypothetical protein
VKIKLTTKHLVNFPGVWGIGDQMECGIAGEFHLSAERVRKCSHVQIHMRDGSAAIEATIFGVHESKKYPGRVSIAYGDVTHICPDPSPNRACSTYINIDGERLEELSHA